jgi:hypothetical protein
MADVKLEQPLYRVVLGDWADSETWTEHRVQTIGPDLKAAETLFGRHKEWGRYTDNPLRFQVVVGYYACRRTGAFSGTWDQFAESYLEVSEVGSEVVSPTPPGVEID